jgi:hypothetical protein
MATLFKVEGGTEEFSMPEKMSLEFLQAKVGGLIEFVPFADGSALMVNEEGRLLGLKPNSAATVISIAKGWPEVLFGNAVFFSRAEMEAMEKEEDEPESCECDNTHEANNTVCRWCWSRGRRKPSDAEVQG